MIKLFKKIVKNLSHLKFNQLEDLKEDQIIEINDGETEQVLIEIWQTA